jgi:hypothetical protein
MIAASEKLDQQLKRRLERLVERDRDYWSFKGNSRREHGHAFCHYPAMMVPQMARVVLEEACEVHPEIEWVCDPFVGSGTILTESMRRGLSFVGKDINPFAVLLCRAKAGPFYPAALREKIAKLSATLDADGRSSIEIDFPGRDKWFRRDVQVSLSRVKRAISHESALWARRFFWVGLAETVRLTSNSRTSTFKLHVRPEDEVRERQLDPIALFRRLINRNLWHFTEQADLLREHRHLKHGHYTGSVRITLGDARHAESKDTQLCDMIVTSPPYGDNASTVPYGQYSYLPLQWIDLGDIDPAAGTEYLRSTHEIDTRSLGGSKRVNKADQGALCDRSPTFRRCLNQLKVAPADRAKRITAFFRDLDACLEPVLATLRPGGLMVWTLGNRKVGGRRVPFDRVLSELLSAHKAVLLTTLNRRISSKRMALRNSVAETMSAETILVMRKAA